MTASVLRIHCFLCILGEMPVQIFWLPFILMGFYLFAQLSAPSMKVPQSLGWTGLSSDLQPSEGPSWVQTGPEGLALGRGP